jgi:hypothetical protein
MLALGVLIGSLFGRDIALIVRAVLQTLALILALILAPLVWLIVTLLDGLFNATGLSQWLQRMTNRPPIDLSYAPPAGEVLAIFPPWLRAAIRIFFALLPVVLILGLLLLARSRARRGAAEDEERQSLWSWSDLAEDLRGLLGNWRRPRRDGGLLGALGRLRGGDPASRVRRSYIRLLLLGEAHQRPRPAPQTPHEYAPTAGAIVPAAAQPIDALTGAYERARYDPEGVATADAEAAERAWAAIEQAERRS